MRIDLTGSEYPSVQANLSPGSLSVLTRSVEGIADGQVRAEGGFRRVPHSVVARLPATSASPPTVIFEGKLDLNQSWEGVLRVTTADLDTSNNYVAVTYVLAVEAVTENEGDPISWRILFGAEDASGNAPLHPVCFECMDQVRNKTVYEHLQEEMDGEDAESA